MSKTPQKITKGFVLEGLDNSKPVAQIKLIGTDGNELTHLDTDQCGFLMFHHGKAYVTNAPVAQLPEVKNFALSEDQYSAIEIEPLPFSRLVVKLEDGRIVSQGGTHDSSGIVYWDHTKKCYQFLAVSDLPLSTKGELTPINQLELIGFNAEDNVQSAREAKTLVASTDGVLIAQARMQKIIDDCGNEQEVNIGAAVSAISYDELFKAVFSVGSNRGVTYWNGENLRVVSVPENSPENALYAVMVNADGEATLVLAEEEIAAFDFNDSSLQEMEAIDGFQVLGTRQNGSKKEQPVSFEEFISVLFTKVQTFSESFIALLSTETIKRALVDLVHDVGTVKYQWVNYENIPYGWLPCDGSVFSPAQFPKLTTLLGVNTTPDLRGRVLAGLDSIDGRNAERLSAFGVEAVTLGGTFGTQEAQMPEHTHNVSLAISTKQVGDDNNHTLMRSGGVTTVSSTSAGSPDAHNNPPTMVLMPLIKAL